MEIIEEIVEYLLRLVFVGEKLNIIYKQHIYLIKLFHQVCHFIHPECLNNLLNELGRRQINHDFFREILHNFVPHRLHQMRFPEPDISIEEKRIICGSWRFCDGFCRRKGKLIIRPCNEGIKTIARLKQNSKILT